MSDLSRGWRRILDETPIPVGRRERLPAVSDRLAEAIFFADKASQVAASAACLEKVNWYVSAFASALCGIRDAAASDFDRLGRREEFASSELALEFFLEHDAKDAQAKDPVAVNRAWWDLRNLRVHFAVSLVESREQVLDEDVALAILAPPARWFLRPVRIEEHTRLRNPQLTAATISLFNRWAAARPLQTVMFHHLYIMSRTVNETAEGLSA